MPRGTQASELRKGGSDDGVRDVAGRHRENHCSLRRSIGHEAQVDPVPACGGEGRRVRWGGGIVEVLQFAEEREAQLPVNGPDRDTPESDATLRRSARRAINSAGSFTLLPAAVGV